MLMRVRVCCRAYSVFFFSLFEASLCDPPPLPSTTYLLNSTAVFRNLTIPNPTTPSPCWSLAFYIGYVYVRFLISYLCFITITAITFQFWKGVQRRSCSPLHFSSPPPSLMNLSA